MLHMRRGGLGTVVSSLSGLLSGVSDRVIASDPGLLRLMMATRGTLAVFLTTLAAIWMGRVIGVAPFEFAAGITFSLMCPFLMREPSRRQRQRTLVMLTVPALAAAVATTILHGQGQLGDMFFLVLVFLAFLLQARSPRGIGIGMIAVIVSYVGLYLELPVSSLPVQLFSVVMALAVTGLACFVLVPMRPVATLRRTVQAVAALPDWLAPLYYSTALMTARATTCREAEDQALLPQLSSVPDGVQLMMPALQLFTSVVIPDLIGVGFALRRVLPSDY